MVFATSAAARSRTKPVELNHVSVATRTAGRAASSQTLLYAFEGMGGAAVVRQNLMLPKTAKAVERGMLRPNELYAFSVDNGQRTSLSFGTNNRLELRRGTKEVGTKVFGTLSQTHLESLLRALSFAHKPITGPDAVGQFNNSFSGLADSLHPKERASVVKQLSVAPSERNNPMLITAMSRFGQATDVEKVRDVLQPMSDGEVLSALKLGAGYSVQRDGLAPHEVLRLRPKGFSPIDGPALQYFGDGHKLVLTDGGKAAGLTMPTGATPRNISTMLQAMSLALGPLDAQNPEAFARTFNPLRQHLTREQRADLVEAVRNNNGWGDSLPGLMQTTVTTFIGRPGRS